MAPRRRAPSTKLSNAWQWYSCRARRRLRRPSLDMPSVHNTHSTSVSHPCAMFVCRVLVAR
eukprot:2414238-Prymnesium_polylepis.1